jgi:hypothetical protein
MEMYAFAVDFSPTPPQMQAVRAALGVAREHLNCGWTICLLRGHGIRGVNL